MGRYVKSVGMALVIVAMAASCVRGNHVDTAGGVGAGAPPAGSSVPLADSAASERFADAGSWLCAGDTPTCGDETIVREPAADCFVVHAPTDPHLGVGRTADEVPALPMEAALAPLCRVFTPRLSAESANAPGDETLEAFRYYAANMNDGRPFVVAAESSRSGEMSLSILDAVRTSSELRPNFVTALLPGVALDVAAQPLDFCTVAKPVGCVMSTPVLRVGSASASVDADVLALVQDKIVTLTGSGAPDAR
jgi:hypothetical protein